ncbi:MAG: preprotein translocase subunit SecE [Thermoclostridium sp.]|nr:preprotein translocase subunit SecE [Thermoclostridium sp.]
MAEQDKQQLEKQQLEKQQKEKQQKEKVQKEKKPNILQKLSKFVKEIRGELKKVLWPSRKQVINNTLTVLVTCLVLGGVIWILDYALGLLYTLVFI